MNKHTLIIRDDDLNTTSNWQQWRETMGPLLDNGIPVSASIIPNVNTDKLNAQGSPEGYLNKTGLGYLPLYENSALSNAISQEPLLYPMQHGFCHGQGTNLHELDVDDRAQIQKLLRGGESLLKRAGIDTNAFVAPYDQFSAAAFQEITKYYKVFSAGYLSTQRVNVTNLASYLLQKKLLKMQVLAFSGCRFVPHQGCLLDPAITNDDTIEDLLRLVVSRPLTVLVIHHWQYAGSTGNQILKDLAHAVGRSSHIMPSSLAQITTD